jgi:hypothetical protein
MTGAGAPSSWSMGSGMGDGWSRRAVAERVKNGGRRLIFRRGSGSGSVAGRGCASSSRERRLSVWIIGRSGSRTAESILCRRPRKEDWLGARVPMSWAFTGRGPVRLRVPERPASIQSSAVKDGGEDPGLVDLSREVRLDGE